MFSRLTYFTLSFVCLVFAIANNRAKAEEAGTSSPDQGQTDGHNTDDSNSGNIADPTNPDGTDEKTLQAELDSLLQSIDSELSAKDDKTLGRREGEIAELIDALKASEEGKSEAEVEEIEQKISELTRRLQQVIAARKEIRTNKLAALPPEHSTDNESGLGIAGLALGAGESSPTASPEIPIASTDSISPPSGPLRRITPESSTRPTIGSAPAAIGAQASITPSGAGFGPMEFSSSSNSPKVFPTTSSSSFSPPPPPSNGAVVPFTDPSTFFSTAGSTPENPAPQPAVRSIAEPSRQPATSLPDGFVPEVIRPLGGPSDSGIPSGREVIPETASFQGTSDDTITRGPAATFNPGAKKPFSPEVPSLKDQVMFTSDSPAVRDEVQPLSGKWIDAGGRPPNVGDRDDNDEDDNDVEPARKDGGSTATDVYAPPSPLPFPPGYSSDSAVAGAQGQKPASKSYGQFDSFLLELSHGAAQK